MYYVSFPIANIPQNRPCTPKIVGTFYMQGYKVKEKTAIVPHCTPSFKTQWAPWKPPEFGQPELSNNESEAIHNIKHVKKAC